MNIKKSFKIYYLLIYEGSTEFNIFRYLTTNKFRELFEKSDIKFSNKVEIITNDKQEVSQGNLGGAGNIGHFKAKYTLIKDKYAGQKLFFILDNDLDDSLEMKRIIEAGGDIIQFVEYNSEYLLLKLSGKNPKKPFEFTNLKEFRIYTENEFKSQFGKDAPDLKDSDLDIIFATASYEDIVASFDKLFSTLEI